MTLCISPNGRSTIQAAAPVDRVLVGTLRGVHELRREGSRWETAGCALESLHVSSLLYEPEADGYFAGIHEGGVYFSPDGADWQPRSRGLTVEHVYTVAWNDGVLYAGTQPAHLFRSVDRGETWTELPALRDVPDTDKWRFPASPHDAHVKNLAFDPRDSRVIYAGVEQGALLKTEDGGESWRELASYSLPTDEGYRDVHRLLVRPSNPDEIFMSTGVGLYHSSTAGETWQRLTNRSFRIGYPDWLLLSPDESQLFMSGGSDTPTAWRTTHDADACIVRSDDGARTWREVTDGLPTHMRHNVEAMALASHPGGFTLFAANTTGEVYASDDRGDTWQRIVSGLPPISKARHYFALAEGAAA